MKTVILSTDTNPDYLNYLPYVRKAWNKLGWNTLTFYIGDDDIESSDNNKVIRIDRIDGYRDATVLQVSRLFGANYIDGLIMTGDVDMMPLSDYWQPDVNKWTVYGSDLTNYKHYPICYISAPDHLWRDVFNETSIKELLDKYTHSKSENFTEWWFVDQDIATERIKPHNPVTIPRGFNHLGTAKNRIDRPVWKQTLQIDELKVDAHMPRPFDKHAAEYLLAKYINKTPTSEDILSGNTFKAIADCYLDNGNTTIDINSRPEIIFLKTDWIAQFKNKILPKIDYRFKLITHNSDLSAPANHHDLLNDERLVKWYSVNCDTSHPKLQSIPIGIANETWPHGDKDTLLQVMSEETAKTHTCYSNFDISTNRQKRQPLYNTIVTKPFITHQTQKLSYRDYLRELKTHRYAISPPGNGVDCHRTWESIYLGVIPIVEKNIAYEYYTDMPILFVDSFDDITEELLTNNELYNSIIGKQNIKCFTQHYKDLITYK